MFAAFEGWNDGGTAATGSLEHMIKAFGAQRFASIDPEEFYVFSENRPTVNFTEEGSRSVTWQRNEFYQGRMPGTDQDAVLFTGVEPNLRWRTFCSVFTELAANEDVVRRGDEGVHIKIVETIGIDLFSHTDIDDRRNRTLINIDQ